MRLAVNRNNAQQVCLSPTDWRSSEKKCSVLKLPIFLPAGGKDGYFVLMGISICKAKSDFLGRNNPVTMDTGTHKAEHNYDTRANRHGRQQTVQVTR